MGIEKDRQESINWMRKCIQKSPTEIKNAKDIFQDEKEIILECVKNNGLTIEYASNRLKNDKEIVLIALKNNPESYKYLSNEILNDIDVYMLKNRMYLRHNNKEYLDVEFNFNHDKKESLLNEINDLIKNLNLDHLELIKNQIQNKFI